MAFDFNKAAGLGTDTIDESVLGAPFINIIQKGSPEFDETHRDYAEKRIENCRPGNILFEPTREILAQPLRVIPLAQLPHYTEWKPNKGGFVGHRPLDIVRHKDYRKGVPGTPTEYKEYLGQNEIVYTILFMVLFHHKGEWKRGMIAFTNKQLKKARNWSKTIKTIRLSDKPDLQLPIFAAVYELKTEPESNEKGGWFGWNISAPKLLKPDTDQALLETAFEASVDAHAKLPRPQIAGALAAPATTEVVDDDKPF